MLFGATHDRDDTGTDPRDGDNARNLAELARGRPGIAQALDGAGLAARASIRATTPDRLPMAGPAAGRDGMFVLGGMGSRGFGWAPLLAEHVAALATGTPSPLPAPLAALIAPGRFAERAARRGRLGKRDGT